MFFDSITEIPQIAARAGTSIFVVPRDAAVEIPGAIVIQPEQKSTISIEQVRAVSAKLSTKQLSDVFILIRPAEQMRPEAANALLKTLEQPGDKVHFVLVTEEPSALLPTILSRAALYVLKKPADFLDRVEGDEAAKKFARRLLVAKNGDLVDLAREITTPSGPGVQKRALEVLRLAIEMAYKSYFKYPSPAFLPRLRGLLAAYQRISAGCNIKLQIVANLC